ncbi:hypothetical protein [Mesoterricola sediminis]|uniref:Uncharacterized protein n=1 Tax=Mesoterricola sediminis TaxID=2927980 RepID=A0AA48GY75_9BACT|nr:hypothetical protein [Mesoterricola sediminis]BDU77800.1 hypothetical protein METESE_27580 [Mesoterricola sediminis]
MDVNLFRAALYSEKLKNNPRKRKGLIVFLCIISIPSLVATGIFSHYAANALGHANPYIIGLVMANLLLGSGTLSGIWDGTCTLNFEPFRPFIAPPHALFLSELVASLFTPIKVFLWIIGLAACFGASLAHPSLLFSVIPCIPLMLLWLICLEHLVGSVSRHVGSSLKILAIYAVVFFAMRALISFLLKGQTLRSLPIEQFGIHLAPWLPTTQLVLCWEAILSGGWPPLNAIGLAVGWTIILIFATYGVLRRDLLGETRHQADMGFRKPWTFDRLWMGVAKYRWYGIISSKNGRIFLFLPFIALLSLIEPLAVGLRPGPSWTVGCMSWVMLPLGGKFSCALFGFDRASVRGYWTLPLEDSDLLLGKLAGTLLYKFTVVFLLMLCAVFATPMPPSLCLYAFLLCSTLALAQARVGLRFSIQHPQPLDPKGMNPSEMDDTGLKRLGLLLLPWAILMFIWVICLNLAPWLLGIALFLALLTEAFALYKSLLRSCGLLHSQRDQLTAALEHSNGADQLPNC